MKYKKNIVALISIISVFLSGCATTYHKNGFLTLGGYENHPAKNDLEYVYFTANGFTSDQRTNEYVLLRAAQIGEQRNKKYFSLYNSIADSVIDKKMDGPTLVKNSDTSYNPDAFAYVDFHNQKQADDFSVEAILKKYGKKYL